MRTDRVFARMEARLDRSFAQKIKFTPLLQHEDPSSLGETIADPDREMLIVDCVFENSYVSYQLGKQAKGQRNDSFNEIIDDHPYCLLRKNLLPFDLKKGDEVERIETNELYIIADIKPDELGRILINLHNISESQI